MTTPTQPRSNWKVTAFVNFSNESPTTWEEAIHLSNATYQEALKEINYIRSRHAGQWKRIGNSWATTSRYGTTRVYCAEKMEDAR